MKAFYLRHRIVFNSYLLSGVLALSACTGKKNEVPLPTPETESTKVPAPQKKTLRLVITDDVKSGDPANFNDTISAGVMGNIFDGLYGFKYLGKLGEVEPVLAEAMPSYSDKDKTVTIKIKKGIFFQDDPAFSGGKGREVTAEDFVYSLKRISDPQSSGSNVWMFDGILKGLAEWRADLAAAKPEEKTAAFTKSIEGLSAPDRATLVFKLLKPYPQLVSILAMNPTAVVAREVVEKYGAEIINHPVGTGPFQMKEWIRGSKIVLVKNPNYRQDFYPTGGSDEDKSSGLLSAVGDQMPFVDEVQYDVVKEEQPRWLLFRAGSLAVTGIPKDNFKETIGADGHLTPQFSTEGVRLHKAMGLTSWWLEFNLKDPLLGKNKNLRKAIAFAFDRAKALNLLYNDRGVLAIGPIPPSLEGGSNLPAFPYEFNVEKAKKALADAGFPAGKKLPALTLDLRSPGKTSREFGELLQANLAAVGIKLEVIGNSFPEALEKAKTGRFQIMLSGWAADYPDPENFLANWYGPNKAPGNNTSNFANKEYDKLYDQIRVALPSPTREKSIARMVQILNDELPGAFFFHGMEYEVSRGWLKNYKSHLLLYGTAKYLDIDQSPKQDSAGESAGSAKTKTPNGA